MTKFSVEIGSESFPFHRFNRGAESLPHDIFGFNNF